MAQAIWRYRCDEGHEWKIFRDLDALEEESDAICPFGHPAVTLQKCEMVQPFEITIRPAEEIGDRAKNQTRLANRYYIVVRVLDESGEWSESLSQKIYPWEDAAPIVSQLLSMPMPFMLRHIQKY